MANACVHSHTPNGLQIVCVDYARGCRSIGKPIGCSRRTFSRQGERVMIAWRMILCGGYMKYS